MKRAPIYKTYFHQPKTLLNLLEPQIIYKNKKMETMIPCEMKDRKRNIEERRMDGWNIYPAVYLQCPC